MANYHHKNTLLLIHAVQKMFNPSTPAIATLGMEHNMSLGAVKSAQLNTNTLVKHQGYYRVMFDLVLLSVSREPLALLGIDLKSGERFPTKHPW